MWRGGRVVECAGLEIRYTVIPYRGFESLPLRQVPFIRGVFKRFSSLTYHKTYLTKWRLSQGCRCRLRLIVQRAGGNRLKPIDRSGLQACFVCSLVTLTPLPKSQQSDPHRPHPRGTPQFSVGSICYLRIPRVTGQRFHDSLDTYKRGVWLVVD